MGKFALGWRKDRPGNDMPAHHLVKVAQAAKVEPLAHPSLLEFRGSRQDQFNVGACWAFATSRVLQLFWQSNGMGTDVIASQRFLYYNGRREEYAGQDPTTVPKLTDTGTEPRLGLQAAQADGVASLVDCPYIGEPDPNNIQPPVNVYETAYDATGMQYARFSDIGKQRVSAVADSMIHRLPVEFGMQVDSAFMDNGGQRITSINSNQIEGGHMLAILAVLDAQFIADHGNQLGLPQDSQPGDILFDNWWGIGSWGTRDGYGVMAGGLFGSSWISDVYAIKGAPLLRKAA